MTFNFHCKQYYYPSSILNITRIPSSPYSTLFRLSSLKIVILGLSIFSKMLIYGSVFHKSTIYFILHCGYFIILSFCTHVIILLANEIISSSLNVSIINEYILLVWSNNHLPSCITFTPFNNNNSSLFQMYNPWKESALVQNKKTFSTSMSLSTFHTFVSTWFFSQLHVSLLFRLISLFNIQPVNFLNEFKHSPFPWRYILSVYLIQKIL